MGPKPKIEKGDLGLDMADTFGFDLPTLKSILEHSFDFPLGDLHRLIPQVTIGPELIPAIRAGYFGEVISGIGLDDSSSAFFARELD